MSIAQRRIEYCIAKAQIGDVESRWGLVLEIVLEAKMRFIKSDGFSEVADM